MTEKLYYKDSHLKSFTARVTDCRPVPEGFVTVLDKTAFFPEGGGQSGDTGAIGGICVFDTQEVNGEILHYTAEPLAIGAEYACGIDWEKRFRRMQNHSGEHIVSGLVHRRFGYSNVGFHMGSDCVTIDFDGYLSPEQLSEIEREANRTVADDPAIRCSFPDDETLRTLEYRSKLELTENVRIVEIEGVDRCACCAPHVNSASEIGIIKILSSERRRRGGEGVRVSMLCGLDAYENLALTHTNNAAISVMLSAKREETAQAVERILTEQERLKAKAAALGRALAGSRAEAIGETDGNVCIFDELLEEPALRELINAVVPHCKGIAAVFSGNDEKGYRYIMGSNSVDLRAAAKQLNAGIGGKGGGSPAMIQGSCTGKAEEIADFLTKFAIL